MGKESLCYQTMEHKQVAEGRSSQESEGHENWMVNCITHFSIFKRKTDALCFSRLSDEEKVMHHSCLRDPS